MTPDTRARMQTFVVRVWAEPGRDSEPLHGIVEQVSTGESTSFTDDEQLLALLREPSPVPVGHAGEGGTPQ
jgi:hypothetical protein